jgi:ribonuclease BN (tRNA processing enzyme)
MKRWGIAPTLVDSILVTHLHGDHFGGIPFLLLEAQLVSKRTRPLSVAGPPGLRERIRRAQEVLFPGSSELEWRFPVHFVELGEDGPTEIGGLRVMPYRVVHPSGAPAYALRVECGGAVIAASGDTEWTDSLIEVARGADLFVCEAYFAERKAKFHLDLETLTRHREDLDCRRLVLTHMSEEMIGRLGSIEAECAEDGMEIVLRPAS